jgi:hypothetical protein
VTANYKTQYYLTTSSVYVSPSPVSGWFDSGSSITASVTSPVSGGSEILFVCMGWNGTGSVPASGFVAGVNFTIYQASSINWNWKTQYEISFSQIGVNSDFKGNVLVIDGVNYNVTQLPVSFWWNSGSVHAFSFGSPLTVNASRSYSWGSTSGLSTIENGTLTVATPGSVTGTYVVQVKYLITFDPGVGTDFKGTVLVVDGTNYNVTDLPISFWWNTGSVHTFAYQSPLVVSPNGKQYVWTSTSGLSTAQSGSITVSTNGTLIAYYKTQYYLTLVTSPYGIASPIGSGWYDNDTNATISTPAYVNIILGSSRYRFNGWTTTNMAEMADSTRSPTTALIDMAKTVTADYVVQYNVTLSQSGVGADFTGTVAFIDNVNYNAAHLPAWFWWDTGSIHTFAYQSPLVVSPNGKQYVWTSTSGLSTSQTGSIIVSAAGSANGNYKTQYYLAVGTNPASLTTISGGGWYDSSSSTTLNAPTVANYQFNYWDLDGISEGNGVNRITVTMNGPHTATAYYSAVTPPPIGGYSVSLAKQIQSSEIAAYAILNALACTVLILRKRKRK